MRNRPRRPKNRPGCTKSKGGAHTCHQPYLREAHVTTRIAGQLERIELDEDEYAILREILKESHADEQQYRDSFDETITREVYEGKFAALEHEKGNVEAAILGHEHANRSHFELMENFLDAARSVYSAFVAGDLSQKREVVQLVASNGVLHDKTVRLNLKERPQYSRTAQK